MVCLYPYLENWSQIGSAACQFLSTVSTCYLLLPRFRLDLPEGLLLSLPSLCLHRSPRIKIHIRFWDWVGASSPSTAGQWFPGGWVQAGGISLQPEKRREVCYLKWSAVVVSAPWSGGIQAGNQVKSNQTSDFLFKMACRMQDDTVVTFASSG